MGTICLKNQQDVLYISGDVKNLPEVLRAALGHRAFKMNELSVAVVQEMMAAGGQNLRISVREPAGPMIRATGDVVTMRCSSFYWSFDSYIEAVLPPDGFDWDDGIFDELRQIRPSTHPYYRERRTKILRMLAEGQGVRAIADHFGISVHVIRNELGNFERIRKPGML